MRKHAVVKPCAVRIALRSCGVCTHECARSRVRAQEHLDVAKTLNNLAIINKAMGDNHQALKHYQSVTRHGLRPRPVRLALLRAAKRQSSRSDWRCRSHRRIVLVRAGQHSRGSA